MSVGGRGVDAGAEHASGAGDVATSNNAGVENLSAPNGSRCSRAQTPTRGGAARAFALLARTALCIALGVSALTACQRVAPAPENERLAAFERIDTRIGTGALAVPGMDMQVHYRGWLYNADAPDGHGALIDDSYRRGEPLGFLLGAGRVIRGWDEGVAGMRVGGRRVLRIPASMAYGKAGAGRAIPPDASLVFEVELVGVTPH